MSTRCVIVICVFIWLFRFVSKIIVSERKHICLVTDTRIINARFWTLFFRFLLRMLAHIMCLTLDFTVFSGFLLGLHHEPFNDVIARCILVQMGSELMRRLFRAGWRLFHLLIYELIKRSHLSWGDLNLFQVRYLMMTVVRLFHSFSWLVFRPGLRILCNTFSWGGCAACWKHFRVEFAFTMVNSAWSRARRKNFEHLLTINKICLVSHFAERAARGFYIKIARATW